MVRFVGIALLVSACNFQIRGGSGTDDAGGNDATTDGAIDDMMVIDEPPPIDGNHADWWDPQWMHRRRITLDTSTFTGTVTAFPVLVRLPVLTDAQVNGADIRFVSIDGMTTYSYELEAFNAAGTSPAWISMTIGTSSIDEELYVYWGNANVAAASNGAAVFGANHVSVHHLGSLLDATGNGHTANNGPGTGAPTINIAGRIGGARTFDGNDDYLSLTNSNGPYDFTNQLYASAWVRVAGFEDAYQAIITKGDSSWRMHRSNNSDGASFGWTNQGNNDDALGNTPIMNGAWHHIAIVQTATTKLVYVDGALDTTRTDSDQLDNNDNSVRFGTNEQTGGRFWHGDMDEVRISDTMRDAAWVFAEYKTADPLFATVGADEIY